MDVIIRHAVQEDYADVVRIMDQVQLMHVEWRPDIYKPTDCLLPKEYYEQLIEKEAVYVAETKADNDDEDCSRIVGVMVLQYRHIENSACVTRDIIFVDSMAVDEHYRGLGVGHCFFDELKKLKQEKNFDGIELQVNARNKAAYQMYAGYGFTEKSINMELLE